MFYYYYYLFNLSYLSSSLDHLQIHFNIHQYLIKEGISDSWHHNWLRSVNIPINHYYRLTKNFLLNFALTTHIFLRGEKKQLYFYQMSINKIKPTLQMNLFPFIFPAKMKINQVSPNTILLSYRNIHQKIFQHLPKSESD